MLAFPHELGKKQITVLAGVGLFLWALFENILGNLLYDAARTWFRQSFGIGADHAELVTKIVLWCLAGGLTVAGCYYIYRVGVGVGVVRATAAAKETWGERRFQLYKDLSYGYRVSNKKNVSMEPYPFHNCLNPPIELVAPPNRVRHDPHRFTCSNEKCGALIQMSEPDLVSSRNHAKAIVERRLLDPYAKEQPPALVKLGIVTPIDAFKDFLVRKKEQGKKLQVKSLETIIGVLFLSEVEAWRDAVAGGIAEAMGNEWREKFLSSLHGLTPSFPGGQLLPKQGDDSEAARKFIKTALFQMDSLIQKAVTQDLVPGFNPIALKRYEAEAIV